jgi:hypothetical protein
VPNRTFKAALALAKRRIIMLTSENVSDSDCESVDAELLEAIAWVLSGRRRRGAATRQRVAV